MLRSGARRAFVQAVQWRFVLEREGDTPDLGTFFAAQVVEELHESGYEVFDELSVVTAPFGQRDNVIGVLGVIGPARINYNKVIPVVDITARLLGDALTE